MQLGGLSETHAARLNASNNNGSMKRRLDGGKIQSRRSGGGFEESGVCSGGDCERQPLASRATGKQDIALICCLNVT